MDHKNGDNPYLLYVNEDHVIDARNYKNVKGRYANDATGLRRKKGLTNNSKYVHDGRRVYLEAKKDIPAESEILVEYGKEFWDAVKYNRMIS